MERTKLVTDEVYVAIQVRVEWSGLILLRVKYRFTTRSGWSGLNLLQMMYRFTSRSGWSEQLVTDV